MFRRSSTALAVAATSTLLIGGCTARSVTQGSQATHFVGASTSVQTASDASASRANAREASQAQPLGAGDALGKAVFEQYARSVQTKQRPAAQPSTKPAQPAEPTGAIKPSDPIVQYLRDLANDQPTPQLRAVPLKLARRGRDSNMALISPRPQSKLEGLGVTSAVNDH